jgi:hypothetical protein
MKLVALILTAASLFASEPTVEQLQQQLAESRAEVKALREHIAEAQAWRDKQTQSLVAAYQACLGNAPQAPPKPDTK